MESKYNLITLLMKKILLCCSFIFLISCSSDDSLRSENSITFIQLSINGEVINGQINQSTNLIVFNVVDANLTSLTPEITIPEGATINPSQNLARDFSKELRYTVTAENGTKKEYAIIVNNKKRSGENTIDSFQFNLNEKLVDGIINPETRIITFDLIGVDISSLAPIIKTSEKARTVPATGILQNFNNDVLYSVTAENGNKKIYKVIVKTRPFNTGNDINSFIVNINGESINARINQDSKEISFESGSFDVSKLVPEITISENASISPALDEPVDFTVPVTYTVTAENGESTEYKVLINKKFNLNTFTLSDRKSLYVRAQIVVSLDFINPSLTQGKLFIEDGINQTELPINSVQSFEFNRIVKYNITTKIPENTISSANYKVVYRSDEVTLTSEKNYDILAEGAPKIISTNQNSYSRGDNLIITGENLTDVILVPSKGSTYVIDFLLRNVDISLSPDKKEYKLVLEGNNIPQAFAFFPFSEGSTTRDVIFTKSSRGRLGEKVTININ